jgi:hypothetical protein
MKKTPTKKTYPANRRSTQAACLGAALEVVDEYRKNLHVALKKLIGCDRCRSEVIEGHVRGHCKECHEKAQARLESRKEDDHVITVEHRH